MRVIGIETSGDVTGVAVVDERGVLAEISFRHAMQLSSSLTPRIQDVLKLAGISVRDLGGVAVSQGPGSFTGLRIGVSAAKALAFAARIPIASICTLEALVRELPSPRGSRCWGVIAASKADVFAALFEWTIDGLCPVIGPAVMPAERLADRLAVHPEELVAAATLGAHAEVLSAAAGERLLSLPHLAAPRPATIAALGRARILQGEGEPVHGVAPRYLLLSAAEARRVEAAAAP